jgi:hypothetical protein
MNVPFVVISITTSLLSIGTQSAVFIVINNSNAAVHLAPLWNGSPKNLDKLEPGQSKQYDSALNTVTGMRWSVGQTVFRAEVKLSKVNLGGKFEIQKDGLYTYSFGVDGSGTGQASKTIVERPSRPAAASASTPTEMRPSQSVPQENQRYNECTSLRLTGRESGNEEEVIKEECQREAIKKIPAQQTYNECISYGLTGRESGSEEEAIKEECRKKAGL